MMVWKPIWFQRFLWQNPNSASSRFSKLIVQHFPIINHPSGVPFIFETLYLLPLPVLCISRLFKREWTMRADLSIKQQPSPKTPMSAYRHSSIHLHRLQILLSSMSNQPTGTESNCWQTHGGQWKELGVVEMDGQKDGKRSGWQKWQ